MDAQHLWQTAIERLEEQFPAPACLPRFGETAAFSLVGDVLVVGIKSFATHSTLLHPYGSAIRKILTEIVGHKIEVNYVILPDLFEGGRLAPDLHMQEIEFDLDAEKVLILIEKRETSYAGYAPDVPNSFVTGESREEVVQRIRQAVQKQLAPVYERQQPLSMPQITAEYIDITRTEPDSPLSSESQDSL